MKIKRYMFISLVFIYFFITFSGIPVFAQDSLSNYHFDNENLPIPSLKMPYNSQKKILSTTKLLTTETSPNIIVILADDLAPNQVGISGNTIIQTPNIDTIGKSGAYFKNMYLAIGQCAPSRASILTGKFPHAHGVTANGLLLPNDQLSLPEILKSNGYYTGFVGKCHLGDAQTRFNYDQQVEVEAPDWYNYSVIRNGITETSTTYNTDFLTSESIKIIQSAKAQQATTKKPFFLWLAYNAPHAPTTPPIGSNRYSLDQMQVPINFADDLSTKPPQQTNSLPHIWFQSVDALGVKGLLKESYEVVSNIDDNVGRLMQTVNNLGLKDNTIVIFLSDNGLFFGAHQMHQKGPTFYEEVIKTPFMISYPPLIGAGQKIEALSSSIDILPTIIDILHITPISGISGKSFLPILNGSASQYRQSIFLEFFCQQPNGDLRILCPNFPMRGIVKDNYKFVHYLASTTTLFGSNNIYTYDGQDYELYNLKTDPYETNNLMKRLNVSDHPLRRLYNDANIGKIVRSLVREMAIWQTDTNDPKRHILTNILSTASNTTINISWNSATTTTSEVEYKETGCSTCEFQEKFDLNLTTNHSITLSSLKSNTSYSLKIYNITNTGNGGYAIQNSTTTSQQIPGDLNSDGHVDLFDYNILVADFGNPYTIFDYNTLVSNYGK